MMDKHYILSFYLSAAVLSALIPLQLFGIDWSYKLIPFLVTIHFSIQLVRLVLVDQISKLNAFLFLFGLIVGLILIPAYTILSIPFILKLYLFNLLIIPSYLYNTPRFPKRWIFNSVGIVAMIIIGSLFKIMHWPSANLIYMIGYALLAISLLRIGLYKSSHPILLQDEIDEIGKSGK